MTNKNTNKDTYTVEGHTSTLLNGEVLTMFKFPGRVTYTYKSYYGDWKGLVKLLKKQGKYNKTSMINALDELTIGELL